MTIEIPSGSKSMTLPNGMEVQIPEGAKTMDVPDELFKSEVQEPQKAPQAQNPIAQQQTQETKNPTAAATTEQPKKEYGVLERAWDVATNNPVANFIPTKLKEWWNDDKTINHDSKIDNDFRHNVSALSNPNDPTLTGMVGEWTGSQTLTDLGKRNYSERDVADFRENVIRAAGDKYDVRFDAKTGDAYARPKGSDAEFEKVLNDIGDASWDEVGTRINANLAQVGTEVGMDIGAGVAFDRKYGKYIKHPALRFMADGLVATATAPASSTVGSVAQTAYSGEEISTKRLIEKSKEEAIDNTLATTAAMTGIGIISLGVRAAAKANPFHGVKSGKDEYQADGLYEVPSKPDYIKAEDISANPITTVKNMENRYRAESKAREDKLTLIAKQKAEAEDIYKDFGGIKEQAEVVEMAGQSNAKEILGNHFNHSQERVNAEVKNSLKLTQNFKSAFNLNNKTSADLYRFMRGGMQRVKDFYTSYYAQAQDLILEEMGDDIVKVSSQTQERLNELIKEAKHPLNVENTRLSQAQKSEFEKDYQDLLELAKRDFTEDVPVWNEAKEAYEYVARDTKSYTLSGLFDVQKKFNAFLYKHKEKFTKPQKDNLDTIKEAIYADVHRAIDTREMDDAIKSEMKELWSDANKGYSNYKELTRRSDVLAKLVEDDVPFDVSKFASDVFKNINKRDAGDFDILYTFGKEIKRTGGDLDEFYSSVIDGLLAGAKDIKSPTGEISQGVMRTVKHQNQSLEIMDFDAFHKAFNSIDETTLKKIFGLTPRGEKILQHLKRFDDLASRESVLQQTLLNKEFKMSETAMQQHDQGKLFYSFAYGAKAMLWDSWAKYVMKNKAYEEFFLRAITKERYEDIEPLIKKLDYDQREVPPIQRVDIEKLREDIQAAKEIAQQAFKQLKQIEERSGKSTNAQQVEDVTISGLLEYKATKNPSMRDFDVERVHAKELAAAEGMDASRIARVNNFDDLGREIRDFKLEQRERELGNRRSPSLASVSDDALVNIAEAGDMPVGRNMMPNDWEQLKKMGLTQEVEDESGAFYEVLSEQGKELLWQERQRRASEYKPSSISKDEQIRTIQQRIRRYEQSIAEEKTNGELANDDFIKGYENSIARDKSRLMELQQTSEKDAPMQIQKDDFSQFLESNKPAQSTELAPQMAQGQQLSSYELAKKEAQFFSELLKKVYKESPLKELDESMKKYYNNFKEMFTTFQGGKAKMSLIVPQYISKVYTQEQRNAITTIDDLFGGGGTWGAFMGLQQNLFPNVKKLRIHEFNEFRALKISYLHHAPQKLINILKNDQQVYDLIEGIKMTSIKGNSKSGQVGKGSHGYVAPYLNDMFANHIDQIRADYTQDQIAALYLIADYAARNEKNTRDLLDYLAGQVEGVAKRSAQLKARGVEIEVYNHSSYDDWMPEQGNHVLNMIDPPYYKTKGYQIFKDGVKISDGEYVDIDLYEKTNKLISKIKEAGNLGIYTDEEWVRKPVDLPSGFKSKTDDGRVDYEVLKEISDNIDEFFVVPERIAEREEVLGFINAKGAKNDNSGNGGGAGVRTTNETNRDTAGDNRGNNNNSDGRMERPSQDDVRGSNAPQGNREAETQNRAAADAVADEATNVAREKEAQEQLKQVVQTLNENPPSLEELKALDALANNVNFTQQVFMALRQSASGKPNQLNDYGAKLYLEAKEKYKDVLARKIDEQTYPITKDNITKLHQLRGYFRHMKDSGEVKQGFATVANPQSFKAMMSDLDKGERIFRKEEYADMYYDLLKMYDELADRIEPMYHTKPKATKPAEIEKPDGLSDEEWNEAQLMFSAGGQLPSHLAMGVAGGVAGEQSDIDGDGVSGTWKDIVLGAAAGYGAVKGAKGLAKGINKFEDSVYDDMGKMAGGGTPPKNFIDDHGFYSVLEKTIDEKVGGRIDSASLAKMLEKNGVKQDEIEWSGLKELMESKEKLTREEIEETIKSNRLVVEVVEKTDGYSEKIRQKMVEKYGVEKWMPLATQEEKDLYSDALKQGLDTKYQNYKLDGGENYRELLFTKPILNDRKITQLKIASEKANKEYEEYQLLNIKNDFLSFLEATESDKKLDELFKNKNIAEDAYYLELKKKKEDPEYTSDHWDESNILVFTRVDDRKIDGKDTLFIEELQSDWHQEGRKMGYLGDTIAISGKKERKVWGVPNAPFKKNWHELGLKRMVQEAVANDYDKIAWTTGKQQAQRYSLEKTVDTVVYNDDAGVIQATNGSKEVFFKRVANEQEIEDIMGKELTARLLDKKNTTTEGVHVLQGEELKFGGEGMQAFYDEIVPNTMKKLFKKWGVKPKMEELDDAEQMVWSVDITPKMKEDIKKYGQPLYAVGGAVMANEATKGDEQ